MGSCCRHKEQGFSLVELLIVTALAGIVATALFVLYQTTHRTASTSEEVVEVQQNLRIAMDQIASDLRMAGFMIPGMERALDEANGDALTIRTGSSLRRAARIDQGQTTDGAEEVVFRVALPEMVDLFANNDRVIIVRPPDQLQPVPGQLFTVAALNSGETNNPLNPPTITLGDFTGLAGPAAVTFQRGDMILRTNTPDPDTIRYCLGPAPGCGAAVTTCPPGQICLMRVVNGTAAVVANNIFGGGLQFQYLPAGAGLNDIRAVRVTLTGQTVDTVRISGGEPKVRTLTSVVTLRNR